MNYNTSLSYWLEQKWTIQISTVLLLILFYIFLWIFLLFQFFLQKRGLRVIRHRNANARGRDKLN